MDDREFRRLCVDALRGRLDDATRQLWEAHRRSSPECAQFYANLAATDARASTRMVSAPGAAPPLALPADEEEVTRADTRRLAYWGPVAVLVGALVAGVGALLIFGPDPGSRGKAISIDRTNRPREVDERDRLPDRPEPPSNQPTNVGTPPEKTPVKAPDPVPRQPTPQPTKPEVAKPPDVVPKATLPEVAPEVVPEVTPEPPAVPETHSAPAAEVRKVGGKDPQYRLQSAAGAPRFLRDAATLSRGDRVRLMSGNLDVVVDGLSLRCAERAELRVVTGAGRPLGVQLDYGSYVIDDLGLEDSRVVSMEHAKLELRRAAIMVRADWGQSTIYVLQGELVLTQDKATQTLHEGDSVLIEPGRVSSPAPGKADWEAMDNQWIGPRETLLRADFDTGVAPFDIGVAQAPGCRHSAGALAWDKTRPGVGCSEKGPTFTPASSSRLRFRIKTNSPQLRIQLQVMLDGKYQTVVIPLTLPAGTNWQLIDLPLSQLRMGPDDDRNGFFPGAEHRALQFRYRYPDNRILPSERFLLVDDVEVYTPE